jgi:hypothetical protein
MIFLNNLQVVNYGLFLEELIHHQENVIKNNFAQGTP